MKRACFRIARVSPLVIFFFKQDVMMMIDSRTLNLSTSPFYNPHSRYCPPKVSILAVFRILIKRASKPLLRSSYLSFDEICWHAILASFILETHLFPRILLRVKETFLQREGNGQDIALWCPFLGQTAIFREAKVSGLEEEEIKSIHLFWRKLFPSKVFGWNGSTNKSLSSRSFFFSLVQFGKVEAKPLSF